MQEAIGASETELRVMSFNIWRSGGRSLDKTIEAIRETDPDVVGLQECSVATARTIAKALDLHVVHDPHARAILSREPCTAIGHTEDEWGGFGATIERSGEGRIHLFDAHLQWHHYGPYHLQEGDPVETILAQERAIRMPGLDELLAMMAPALTSGEPTFLVGDFNAPSHLDYASVAWPTSLACEEVGLLDAYRVLHPNNRTFPRPFVHDAPGITWTPLLGEEKRGVFDRIDFIYYSAARTRPTMAVELDDRNCVSPWPSDHRAVFSTFAIRSR